MNLLIVGINHTSAPVELREKVAFAPEQLSDALNNLKRVAGFAEVAVLSTCNRTEIIATTETLDEIRVINWLANYHGLPVSALQPSIYIKLNREAAHHAARVACGLDSMVIGEPQILGQMKDAYGHASLIGTLGSELHHLSQNTFRIAKRVRFETKIGENSVSIASTAVTLSELLFSDLPNRKVLIIGAGDNSKLIGRHLKSAGFGELIIANRTLENARKLTKELDGSAIDLKAMPSRLADTDLVITSTASQLPLLGKGMVEKAIKSRKHRPILMIDLSVPRDIEPEVGELRDIYLYSVDDLQEIIENNLSNRQQAATKAEDIINQEISSYRTRQESHVFEETLVRFRAHHELIKEEELAKAMDRLQNGAAPEDIIRRLANQLTSKMLHKPTKQLRSGDAALLKAISDLYLLKGNSDA